MEGNAHPCQSSPDRDQGARAAARAVDFEECVQVLDDPGQPSPPPLPLRLSSKADIRRSLSRTSRSFSSRINSFYKDQEVRRVILSSVRRFLAWFLLFLAQIFGCRETLWLAYQTLGVVYGDLGTSPLYVYPTAQIDSRNEREYLGVLSVIFWTLTLIGVVKYVLIVLHANDHGEGGTFALYSLLCRHANVGRHAGKHYGRLESDTEFSYFGDAERVRVHTRAKMFLEKSEIAQKILLVCVTFGTCMVIGDGVLTPAISVLSSIGGLRSQVPAISQTVVIAISCVIISALFLLQSIGTHRVSCIFSPIMATWFASTTVIGIYNIMNYYPTVLKALSPHYAIRFFVRNKRHGWEMLNSIVLCITGAEAMFADLGHFNIKAIQIAFIAVVYPSLIITYAGETAFLIKHPEHRIDAFFKSVPSPVFWPVFVVATLAAIVASQALITATFSVLKQSVSFGCFPRIKLVHTSASQEGQIYSPEVNYLLLGLCLAVVIGFQDSDGIGNAYGVAVIWVMLITTALVAVVMLVVWTTSVLWIILFLIVFGAVEVIYLSSTAEKLAKGGWVPFAISSFFVVVSLSWNYGRRMKYEFEAKNRISSHDFKNLCSSLEVTRVPGLCLFYSNLIHGGGLPPLMGHYMRAVGSLHEVVIFLTIRVVPVKTVLESERLFVARGSGVKGLYRCVARYGYLDHVDMVKEEFVDQVIASLVDLIRSESSGEAAAAHCVMECAAEMEMVELDVAKRRGAVHVVGHSILDTGSRSWFKRMVVNKIYRFLHSSCRSAVSTFRIPSSRLLELSMVYET
ncbi:hypothetical protein SELMODRAFT_101574 [Selaginella moellendorffii]|uniref:Potassium transporter n=1 Tax=Selaginella moellendorffii TaxID=88036 RepID=D8RUL5_SELML|nr:hypothetical protein SELMODRAFT_101574 [Selaginella moellendorffii]